MRILLLATHLNPGGISRYVINLARALSLRSHKVFVATSQGSWLNELANAGIAYEIIPINTKAILSFKVFLSFMKLKAFVRKEKIEVIHANTRVTQFLGYLLCKYTKIPYVATFHGFYRPSLQRRIFKLSGIHAIAVSHAVKKHIVHDLHIRENKASVIYNGIDTKLLTPSKKGFSRSDSNVYLGMLGRISEEKGFFLAMEAFASLSASYHNVRFIISGKGKMEDALKEFCRKKGVLEKVDFLELSNVDFFSRIDIVLVPSRKEGFGFTIVEAFSAGVAVIGFNTGGIAELIRNGENGLLFYEYKPESLQESIETLLIDQELRKRIARQGSLEAGRFSQERMAMETERIYQEVRQ
jgi:glycosyltransferase involved in cell wall biosynthesis